MKRIPPALEWTLIAVAAVLVIGVIGFVYLWAYDFDIKCLIAECRRVK